MNGVIKDLRYALRQLRNSPGFTAVAVFTLALGIGADTGIFTLVDAVLLKSLPVPQPEQLFLVRQDDRLVENTRFSYPFFKSVEAVMPPSAEVAAMTWPASFYAALGSAQPAMVTGQLVSGNYFHALATYASLGRLLAADDDRLVGGTPVAVISYGCWQRRFGRDRSVLGRKIVVNGMPIEIVGVAAPGFFGARPGIAPEFWLPTTMQSAVHYAQHYSQSEDSDFQKPWVPQRDIRWLQFIVRIRGTNLFAPTLAALNQVFRQEREASAAKIKDPQERQAFLRAQLKLEPGRRGLSNLRTSFAQPLRVLMGAVGFVLLIACANLANLLLARGAAREREIALRLSIGAGRARLIRQLLTECALLSFLGAGFGVAVAYGCVEVLPKWASRGSTPIPLNLAPDARVLAFTTAVAIVTALLFGVAPAIRSSQVEPVRALKGKSEGSDRIGTVNSRSVKQILIVAQMALSLVLLAGAGLFLRTLHNFMRLNPGFDRDHIVSVWLDTHMAGYSQPQLSSLYKRLIERVEAIPGVDSASLASCGLAIGCGDASDIFLPGVPHTNGETDAQQRRVSPHFFLTTQMPIIEGRLFATSDTQASPPVVIVNQTFAREFLKGKDPIGQYFGYDAINDHRFQIVGLVRDARVNDIRETAPPLIYHSLVQDVVDAESLDVRTQAEPNRFIPAIREAVTSVDPNLPIGGVTTLAEQMSNNLAQEKLVARLTTIFGLLALGLACVGLYGMMSYTVARRTGELGIRLALGASRRAVLWLVLHESFVVIAAGAIAGLMLSFLVARTVSSLLFGLSPYDPTTLIVAVVVLALVAISAGLKPAWRAAHLDPNEALRME
ncbi:MAG TPA: ABC transporter permease [Terriglobales bacterium]